MLDALSPEFVIGVVLFLVLLIIGWKSTEVRDSPGVVAAGLHRSGTLGRDVAIVQGDLLNRLVDQITTGATGPRIRRRRGVQSRTSNNSVEEIEFNEGNIRMTHVLSWASNDSISTGTNTETDAGRIHRQAEALIEDIENEGGPEAIIRAMDHDLYEDGGQMASQPVEVATAATPEVNSVSDTATEEVQNCTNENSENGNKQEEEAAANATVPTTDEVDAESSNPTLSTLPQGVDEEPWKIKIKYLNDEMKVVEAKPSQTIGEFKRLHFEKEISSNKLVRLVFNGKVLQPDGASLRSCALFENCVVHCLVHNMPPSSSTTNTSNLFNRSSPAPPQPRTGLLAVVPYESERPNNLQEDGQGDQELGVDIGSYSTLQGLWHQWSRFSSWRLLIFTMVVIYFRISYAELFTMTATIGLIFVSVMVLGISLTMNIF